MLLQILSSHILKYRKIFLILFAFYAVTMCWTASHVQLAFNAGKVLPITDSAYIRYKQFKKTFGEDGRVMVVGIQSPKLFECELLNDWSRLSNEIKHINGVEEVLSIGRILKLEKDTIQHRFILAPLITSDSISSEKEANAFKNSIEKLVFFSGLIYQPRSRATLMAITFTSETYNSPKRIPVLDSIVKMTQHFENKHHVKIHYSGLPYIRTTISNLVSKEFVLFLVLSVGIAAIILGLFFRSLYAVIFPLISVFLGVATAIATMVLLGYKITLLTGLVPPIIVVIGLPNSILLLNKYHTEYKLSGNKLWALQTAMQRIGFTTFIANLTTAIGFGVLALTGSEVLTEFGIIASLNVMLTYLICITLIPLIFSFLPNPNTKNTKHLDNRNLKKLIHIIDHWVHRRRTVIYTTTIVIIIVSIIGIFKINANGFIVDDLPKNSPLITDLHFFEKNFGGALPLEISIDTRHKNGIMRPNLIHKVDKLEKLLTQYPEFSKPVSLNAALKYATQVFYGGDTNFYRTPNEVELSFIVDYLKQANNRPQQKRNPSERNNNLIRNFTDSNKQITRISFQMADAGSKRINEILREIRPKIDAIFSPKKYKIDVTGSSVIFVKGTNYLLYNLRDSLLLAIGLIALIMWWLFRGGRMIVISLIPNLIPLMITAGLMGFLGINLKPSTILIFSIALGIASDQTIYFLTRYRYDLKKTRWSIAKIISDTLNETGVSMIYTAIILFFGFGIFAASTFGGTVSLGILLSITLMLALISNLILLPALLISLEKRRKLVRFRHHKTTTTFKTLTKL